MIFSPSSETLDLTFLVLPDCSLMTVASSIDPLRAANRISGRTLYRWRLVSADGAPVLTTCAVPVTVEQRFNPDQCASVLVIISGFRALEHAGPELLRRIRRAARNRRRIIGGVESGSWVLAQAGLLEGRAATTHWEDFEEFSDRFPGVRLQPDRFVIDGRFFTTGGASPSFDFMLHLIRCRQGYSAAQNVASVFIYDQSHAGEDAQPLVSLGELGRQEPRIVQAIRLMEEHLDTPLRSSDIASACGISTRTLEMLFRENLESTPGAYYRSLRLGTARRLLRDTRHSITEIAVRTGFSSIAVLSRAFRRHYGSSPDQFRRQG